MGWDSLGMGEARGEFFLFCQMLGGERGEEGFFFTSWHHDTQESSIKMDRLCFPEDGRLERRSLVAGRWSRKFTGANACIGCVV